MEVYEQKDEILLQMKEVMKQKVEAETQRNENKQMKEFLDRKEQD